MTLPKRLTEGENRTWGRGTCGDIMGTAEQHKVLQDQAPLGFEATHPCTPWAGVGWLICSSNLWHTTASKIRAAHQLCFILLATDPSLQSAVPFLIVTSRAPFRVCLKANIGLLIGYINVLNYGEEEEGGRKIPGTYISAKVSESGRI